MSSDVALAALAKDYDSSFDEDDEAAADGHRRLERLRRKRAHRRAEAERDLKRAAKPGAAPTASSSSSKAHHSQFSREVAEDEGRRQRFQLLSLTAYDRHKKLVNDYFLYHRGATAKLARDTTNDKNDLDVIRENSRFLWDDNDEGGGGENEAGGGDLSWGQRLAKKYWSKLFKEYGLCDLSRYKENKIALRWRLEKEVISGKGQFVCGTKKCDEGEKLRTWEVDFAYVERGERRNALVKVRLCPDCSYKLNYFHKKKEVTKRKSKKRKRKKKKERRSSSSSSSGDTDDEVKQARVKQKEKEEEKKLAKKASEIWSGPVEIEKEKSREEDFSEYLEDLFM